MQQPGYFESLPQPKVEPDTEPTDPKRWTQRLPTWISKVASILGVNLAEPHSSDVTTGTDIDAAMVKKYSAHPGRDLEAKEMAHVENLRKLRKSFKTKVQMSSTLDEYFHEFLDRQALKERNSDQVMSRFIARDWQRIQRCGGEASDPEDGSEDGTDNQDADEAKDTSEDDEETKEADELTNSQTAGIGSDSDYEDFKTDTKVFFESSDSEDETSRKKAAVGTPVPATVARQPEVETKADPQKAQIGISSLNGKKTVDDQKERDRKEATTGRPITPRELESQERRWTKSEHRSSFWWRRRTSKSQRASTEAERFASGYDSTEQHRNEEGSEDDELFSSAGVEVATKTARSRVPTTRQQILIVPQIWLWSFGSMAPGLHLLV